MWRYVCIMTEAGPGFTGCEEGSFDISPNTFVFVDVPKQPTYIYVTISASYLLHQQPACHCYLTVLMVSIVRSRTTCILHLYLPTCRLSSPLGPGVPGEREPVSGRAGTTSCHRRLALGKPDLQSPRGPRVCRQGGRVAGMAGRRAKDTRQCGHVVLQEQSFMLRLSETGNDLDGPGLTAFERRTPSLVQPPLSLSLTAVLCVSV